MKLSSIPNYVALFAAAFFLTVGCKKSDSSSNSSTTGTFIDSSYATGSAEGSSATGADADDDVEKLSFPNTVTITFGTTVSVVNPMYDKGVTIVTNGGDVTITSAAANVEYLIAGSTDDGSVKIYSDNDYKLTLNGVTITNNDGPALNLQSAQRAFVVLNENTTSTLKDGSTYAAATEDQKGAIFAAGKIIISGEGTLSVSGKYQYAISSDKYVRIAAGAVYFDAVSDAVHTSTGFFMDGGYLKARSEANGIVVEDGAAIVNKGTVEISAAEDGVVSNDIVTVNGGATTITSAGKGIAANSFTLNYGSVAIAAGGNGVHAANTLYVNGGYIGAGGQTGLHSDANMTFTGGVSVGVSSANVASGIDCPSGTFKITGGVVLGAGRTTSKPDATVTTIATLIMGSGTASKVLHVEETLSGRELFTFSPFQDFSTLLYASSKLQQSTSYGIFRGGYVSGNVGSDTVVATYGNYNFYKSGYYISETGKRDSSFTTGAMLTQIGGTVK